MKQIVIVLSRYLFFDSSQLISTFFHREEKSFFVKKVFFECFWKVFKTVDIREATKKK